MHVDRNGDDDDSLFSLIAEDTNIKLKFSQVERLLIQRHKLQMQEEGGAADQERDNSQAQGSSLYSYFGFNSSNAAQDYLTVTSSDRTAVVKTE